MALYQGASKTWYVINRRGEGRRRGGKRDRRRRRGRENKFIETRQIWKGPLCIPNNSSPRAIRIMSDDIYATNSGDEIFFFFLQYQQPWSNWKEKRKEGGGKRMGLSKRGGRRKRSRQRIRNSGSGRNITSYVVFQTLFLGLWWKMSRGRGRVREGIHEDHQRELDCENTSVTSNVKYTDGERARGKESTKASFPFSLSEFDRLLSWLPLRYFWVISLSLQPSRLFDGSSSDHRLSLPFCCFLSPSPVYWECITSPVFLTERLGNPPPAHTYLCNTIRRRCASYSWQWPWWRPLSICSNTYKHNIYCHVK